MSEAAIHIANGRAQRHPQTLGVGRTWCGRKLLGKPEGESGGIETFLSYGNRLDVSWEPGRGTCQRCREAFNAAYVAVFPEGLKPIAAFRADDPADMERARNFLSPAALTSYLGVRGKGMDALERDLAASEGHPLP
jgi:hypothetical protein